MISIEGNSVLINNDETILEMKFISDEFVWMMNSKEMIIDHNNLYFYEELFEIMNNNYTFGNVHCYKDSDKLVWLSDQFCDLDDIDSLSRINRLIIDRLEDKFLIRIHNPFFEENNINKSYYVVSFSPLFNGYYSRNEKNGLSLQDEFCLMYQKLLRDKRHVLK